MLRAEPLRILLNISRRIRYFLLRDRMTAELEEEMRLHRDLLEARDDAAGVDAGSGGGVPARGFGNATALVELSREQWGARWLDSLVQDGRHAVRSLRQSRAITTVVVVTLAVVIGANTAIFGLLHAVFLQKLDLPGATGVRAVYAMNHGRADDISIAEYRRLQRAPNAPPLEAYWITSATVAAGTVREDVWVDMVSGGFLGMLGVKPVAGRLLSDEDERLKAPVAVISESMWSRGFGRDPAAIGRTVVVNGSRVTIVGVLPSSFHSIHFARRFSVAMPLTTYAFAPGPLDPDLIAVFLVSRVIPREEAVARAALDVAYRSCCLDPRQDDGGEGEPSTAGRPGAVQYPVPGDNPTGLHGEVTRERKPHVVMRDASRGITWSVDYRAMYGRVLFGVGAGVVILLLIACANIATLLLARAVTREREFAVQMSMGAGRARLVRQLLCESALLAVIGSAFGLLVAYGGTTLLVHNMPATSVTLADAITWHSSPRILLFTAAAAVACTLLFGMWPALRAARTDLLTPLKGGIVPSAVPGKVKAERALIIAQVALALVLISTGSLLIRTLQNLSRPTGARAAHTAIMVIDAEESRYAQAGELRMATDAMTLIAGLPGVRAVTASRDAPIMEDMYQQIEPRGLTAAQRRGRITRLNVVTPNFFDVTGIPLRAGRAFGPQDRKGAPRVMIVSESFVRRYLAGENPVGVTMDMGDVDPLPLRIVGVASDAAYDDPHSVHTSMVYLPVEQAEAGGMRRMALTILAEGDASSLVTDVRRAMGASLPAIRIEKLRTVAGVLEEELSRERLAAALAALFGSVALLLVSVGVYGLLSHSTAQRTHEIGVRMALGARAADAVRLVLAQSLSLLGTGVLIGLPLAFAGAWMVRSQLFEVSATDPRMVLLAAALLIVAGTLASLIPGRRAARVDPLIALRSD